MDLLESTTDLTGATVWCCEDERFGAHRRVTNLKTLDDQCGALPPGLKYAADFLSVDEEAELLNAVQELDWDAHGLIRRRGRVVKRREIDFIHEYGRHNRQLAEGLPLPPALEDVRARCASCVGVQPALFKQVIVSMYPRGAGIDWHVDSTEAFGDLICGISLAAPCVMQFRQVGGNKSWSLMRQPRDLLVLRGPSRFEYQHRIPPVKATRYSITLRTLQ